MGAAYRPPGNNREGTAPDKRGSTVACDLNGSVGEGLTDQGGPWWGILIRRMSILRNGNVAC